MAGNPTGRLIQPPGAVVEQGPGKQPQGIKDQLIEESTIGGPMTSQDVRMLLDKRTLLHLLDVCNESMTGRCILHQVGFKRRVWRGGDGNLYQTLSIISLQPRAENRL